MPRFRIKQLTGRPARFKMWRIAGALLVIAGLCLLGYVGYQKAMVAYHQSQLRQAYRVTIPEPPVDEASDRIVITEQLPMRIIIPRINVDLVVQHGDVYDMKLHDRGPIHFGETIDPDTGELILVSPLPGTEPGNVAIAAHRGARWGFFTDLDFLEKEDEIYLDIGGYRFIYMVEWIKIVDPDDWSAIYTTDYPAVTLQTCEPKHSSSTHRLIVRAALDEVIPVLLY